MASLARQIKDKGLVTSAEAASVVTAYEEEMLVRGKDAVLASNENTLSIHDWTRLMKSPLFTAGVAQQVSSRPEQNKENDT